ncbi:MULTISPECIES: recombination mediator RecR [Pseudobutyrivibrio]|jgi:recombination protein RecR|uniref:Recombination protein RecR n=1 Tax=Pseudobutyrivibrio ruminis TaxID=46206 RepID=A0A1H7LUI7_9FIRM|nr:MULTISPECIES: recombination mediator RecR [Pseudobutyrivibrio]SEL02613.1 DNA replication and repair protein RecR [Pseudobutyrivibrio ruminis]SET14713.1 DNA replication and repair protein RecR [Pseudobutyrivibrio sp. C4]SFO60567.1 DNA replication and repair protein RecR [Pseudobutyrivibrio sp. JW11]
MEYYSKEISNLIAELSDLPSIGSKSAQRLAFHILGMDEEKVNDLANAIVQARKNVRYCKQCFTLTDDELCPICSNPKRNQNIIMVVEDTRDLAAYEKTGKFEGVYHVLHGAISPMAGIGPGDIKLKELMVRLQQTDVEEVIIATNSSLEGETTAAYISKLIKPTGIRVSRIASGVPVGGNLEYIDEVTLLRALDGRTEL